MKIEINSNPCFKGRILTKTPTKLKTPVIRPLVNYLKHSCGNNKILHSVQIGENYISIISSYTPESQVNNIDFLKRETMITNKKSNSVTKKLVNKAIKWASETNNWQRNIEMNTDTYKYILQNKKRTKKKGGNLKNFFFWLIDRILDSGRNKFY